MENNLNSMYEYHAVDQALEDEFCRSSELQRLYTRRRSISLTSEVDPDLILPIVAKVRIQRESYQPGVEPIDDEVDQVVRRRHPPKRNTSDPKRPSSMLVHENEELLQLADELHLRDLQGLRSGEDPKSGPSKYSRRSSTCAGILLYQTVSDDQNADDDSKTRTLTQKDLEALRRISVCSSQPSQADGVPLKLSPKSSSSKLPNFGHLFGSGAKRGGGSGSNPPVVANVGTVQSKIAKKLERQQSKEGSSDQRRAQFLQTRSNTGLNFFSNRRRSIAVADDAYNISLRSAKSHLDLSGDQNGHSEPDKGHKHEAEEPRRSTEAGGSGHHKKSLQRNPD